MEVVLVVRMLAAVAIVVSVCCGTTALIGATVRAEPCVVLATLPLRIRSPSCVNAGGCVNALKCA